MCSCLKHHLQLSSVDFQFNSLNKLKTRKSYNNINIQRVVYVFMQKQRYNHLCSFSLCPLHVFEESQLVLIKRFINLRLLVGFTAKTLLMLHKIVH